MTDKNSPKLAAPAATFFQTAQKAIARQNFAEAEAALAQALSLDEGNALYWHKLGMVWVTMGRQAEGLDALQMAYNLDPSNQELPELLGDLYYLNDNFQQASFYFLKSHQIKKNNPKLQNKLAIALYKTNETARAVSLMCELIVKYPDNPSYMSDFAEIARSYTFQSFDDKAKQAISLCLRADHLKFLYFAASWASLLLHDPSLDKLRQFSARYDSDIPLNDIAPQLADKFLCAGLDKIPVTNPILEIMLGNLRRYFLVNWQSHAAWPKEVLGFLSALATQCWYNDFVFFRTDEEIAALPDLQKFLTAQWNEKGPHSDSIAMLTALCASYIPLYDVYTGEGKLPFEKAALMKMKPLITAQLDHPRTEQQLLPTIPDFTVIEDATSRAVQAMYEQRPYPRWRSTSTYAPSADASARSQNISVLVAGCGTGQEPILYANALPKCHVTAVDLSRTSIAYAKRMADDLKFLPRINFLHGDLMKVGEIGKTFDFVASSGVLHHLKEPEKGLAAILETLKPGGRMSISLYSKAARDYTLGPASDYIQAKHYTTGDDDIRRFRRDLLTLGKDAPETRCMSVSDFYSLSECNDLLFHIQEHRYTPTMIWEMAERHGLVPYHIYMTPHRQRVFAEMFPGQSPLSPVLLDELEKNHPTAFLDMYKIYFHRKNEGAEHPLDPLIFLGII